MGRPPPRGMRGVPERPNNRRRKRDCNDLQNATHNACSRHGHPFRPRLNNLEDRKDEFRASRLTRSSSAVSHRSLHLICGQCCHPHDPRRTSVRGTEAASGRQPERSSLLLRSPRGLWDARNRRSRKRRGSTCSTRPKWHFKPKLRQLRCLHRDWRRHAPTRRFAHSRRPK